MGNTVESPPLESQQGCERLISPMIPAYEGGANPAPANAALPAVFDKFPDDDLRVTRNYGFLRPSPIGYRNASRDASIHID
jgi:hypothetical protein